LDFVENVQPCVRLVTTKGHASLALRLILYLNKKSAFARLAILLIPIILNVINALKVAPSATPSNNAPNAKDSFVYKSQVVFTTAEWVFTSLRLLALSVFKAVLVAKMQ
jgi:hypothetical protein